MLRGDRRVSWALAALSFLALEGLGHQTWGTIDAVQRLAVTRSILTSGSVITEAFGAVRYGPLQSVLMIPTYALGYGIGVLGKSADPDHIGYRATAFLFTPLLVSALLAAWYRFARRLGHAAPLAAWGAWTLLWCTLVLPYARLLFSELLSAAALVAAGSCLMAPAEAPPRRAGFWFLAAASLNYVIYFPILLAAAIGLPIREYRRRGAAAARSCAASGAAAVAATVLGWGLYNVARFGSALRFGYEENAFTTPIVRGLYGLLASPGRGLAFYSLPTALAVVFLARDAIRRRGAARLVPAVSLVLFVFYLALYARWGAFEGGWCWGPRFLLPFVPLVHLALLPATTGRRALVRVALAGGLLVNAWEYATEWRAWEKATFDGGTVEYLRSVFEPRYVSALHGFAGMTTLERSLQFAAVAAVTSLLLAAVLRRASKEAAGETAPPFRLVA